MVGTSHPLPGFFLTYDPFSSATSNRKYARQARLAVSFPSLASREVGTTGRLLTRKLFRCRVWETHRPWLFSPYATGLCPPCFPNPPHLALHDFSSYHLVFGGSFHTNPERSAAVGPSPWPACSQPVPVQRQPPFRFLSGLVDCLLRLSPSGHEQRACGYVFFLIV